MRGSTAIRLASIFQLLRVAGTSKFVTVVASTSRLGCFEKMIAFVDLFGICVHMIGNLRPHR